jgi:UDP-glucuronate 4-epimerase
MATVLITGAAGFVGSRLAAALLARGDVVVGLDNFDPYYALEHKRRHLADISNSDRFTFVQADLRDAAAIEKIVAEHKPAAIAHMAGMAAVRYSIDHPLIYGEANVQGSMHVLDAARKHGNPVCVLASTGSVYGTSTPVPFKEDAAADRPLAPYPASKRAMELMAHAFHHLYQTPVTAVRFFNVYGPHGRPDMMPWQWTMNILAGKPLTLYNGGRIKRDWTYIDDIVAGLILALDKPFKEFEILNLGCSNPVENLAFIEVLEKLLGKAAIRVDTPTPASEPLITYADVSKAKRLLGYEPKVRVEAGLAKFVGWLRAEKLIEI